MLVLSNSIPVFIVVYIFILRFGYVALIVSDSTCAERDDLRKLCC